MTKDRRSDSEGRTWLGFWIVPSRFPGLWGAVLLLVLLIVLELLIGGGVYVLEQGVLAGVAESRAWSQLPSTVGVALAFVAVATLGIHLTRSGWREVLSLRPFRWPLLLGIVLAFGGGSVVLSELDNLVRMVLPMPEWMDEFVVEEVLGNRGQLSHVLTVVLVAPLIEEALFRGLLLRGLLRNYGPLWAVLITAVLFSLSHLLPVQFLGAFGFGLLLGWVYLRTRSLWPCIIAHAIANLVPSVTVWTKLEIPGYTLLFDEPCLQPWWLDLGALLMLLGGIALIWKLSTPYQTPGTSR